MIVKDLLPLAKPIEKFTPDPANARKHDEKSYEVISNSLRQFGQRTAIVAQEKDGQWIVRKGNGTLEAAKRLGWTEIAAVIVNEDSVVATAYAIADNKSSDLSTFDDDVLKKTLSALMDEGIEIEDFGFDAIDLGLNVPDEASEEKKEDEEKEDEPLDEIPEKIEPVAKTGDVITVGDATLYVGDCLDSLKKLAENSVDAMLTDPPAGISFMGKDWDDDKGGSKKWIAWLESVMSEAKRVLKPGAHGLVWAIPRTSHWTATALENAGFEIRDVVTHLFGSGFPKSLDISKAIDKAAGAERKVIGKSPYSNQDTRGNPISGTGGRGTGLGVGKERLTLDITAAATDEAKQWQGFGTALKPASEHWILIRKPISEDTVAANVLKWGCGGINIDGSRVQTTDKLQKLSGTFSFQSGLGADEIGKKIDLVDPGLGRFPANLVLSHNADCEDEKCSEGCAVKMLDEQSGISKSTGGRVGNKPANHDSNLPFSGGYQKGDPGFGDTGGASRFFYCAKPSKSERNAGLDGMPKKSQGTYGEFAGDGRGRQTEHQPTSNFHPTVKPIKLMQYFATMITPPNGTIIDCFNGSGTTGLAALSKGFKYIGMEKELEYADISVARWKAFSQKPQPAHNP